MWCVVVSTQRMATTVSSPLTVNMGATVKRIALLIALVTLCGCQTAEQEQLPLETQKAILKKAERTCQAHKGTQMYSTCLSIEGRRDIYLASEKLKASQARKP